MNSSETGPVQRLREIADRDIGGNNPNLADVLNEFASVPEADMAGPDSPVPPLALVRRDDLREGAAPGAAGARLREATKEPDWHPADNRRAEAGREAG
jgi:hypothetical protein